MIENRILNNKALGIINKKLRNEKITQQDSNYLSRFIRPKLRDAISINAETLLKKLEYNPKTKPMEKKIKNIILEKISKVDLIIICGSAIQTSYKEYNDIDIIVATKSTSTKSWKEKRELIRSVEEIAKKQNLNLDIQIYSKDSILSQYSHNPSLIYQLKDSKIVYGKLKIPKKINLSSLDLKMKLDWSGGLDIYSEASAIYYAIRNAMLVLLLINRKIDNYQLRQNLINILGEDLFIRLKNNQASKIEKKLTINYLNLLIKYLEEELNKPKWEKIEIENL
ncbi:hypothetical protein HYV50_04105 [Candidatus Pacearchaeota archaeon]|nr:hypothetical protein [Candidatus Pacearchaeota archaeon]